MYSWRNTYPNTIVEIVSTVVVFVALLRSTNCVKFKLLYLAMQFFLAILFERFKLLNNFLFNFIAKNNKNRKETIDALCVVAALLVDIYNLSRLVSLLYLSKI